MRSSLSITSSVWRALFLREALARLFSSRAAWFWMLAEPMFHIMLLVFIFTIVRVRTIGGIDTTVWVMVGLLAFFLFRRTGTQVTNAIDANRALFTYRQVKPVDTALVRAVLEALLMIVISFLLIAVAGLLGHIQAPDDPLMVMGALGGLWLFALGFGLIVSVISDLVPELGHVVKLVMTPLYFISGVIYPVSAMPQPYRDILLMNPITHGLEAARSGFSLYYHVIPELSVSYLYGSALFSMFLGLALHRRYALRLVTQ